MLQANPNYKFISHKSDFIKLNLHTFLAIHPISPSRFSSHKIIELSLDELSSQLGFHLAAHRERTLSVCPKMYIEYEYF